MLTVKFLARTSASQDPALWTSLLPGGDPTAFGVRYTFDFHARDYDYLVVYEDLPYPEGSKRSTRVEPLACARANTLFVTTEPTSIKVYGRHYLRQFGHVISKQPREVVDHSGHIHQTPPLRWYYGRPFGGGDYVSVDQLAAHEPVKTRDTSTVCSAKRMADTLHAQRFDFTFALPELMEIDIFGRGVRPIADKAEAMDPYRYHLAVENHISPGHWTEKIADCFLAGCLPFYYGPPDIGDVFPPEAVVPVDIFDVEGSAEIMRKAVRDDAYTRALPALREARRRVLEDGNILKACADIALETHAPGQPGGEVLGRHAFRRAHPVLAARDAVWSRRMRSVGEKTLGAD